MTQLLESLAHRQDSVIQAVEGDLRPVTILFAIFPATLRADMGQPDVYYETAAAITVLVLLGQMLELRARAQTGSAVRALLDLGSFFKGGAFPCGS